MCLGALPLCYVVLGDAKNISNVTSDGGVDLFYAEFHADFKSGLHFDLRGCISEHKSNFQIEVAMKRFNFFKAIDSFYVFFALFRIVFYHCINPPYLL